MKNSRFTLYRIVIIGLMAAMVFVCTMFLGIRIPTPTGTTQLKTANAICLLTGLLFGGWTGGLAAGIGSALFDLTYPEWAAGAWLTLIPLLCCLAGSLLTSLLYCFLTVTLKANQNVTGLAITTLGVGVGNFFGGSLIKIVKSDVPYLALVKIAKAYKTTLPFASGMGPIGQLFFSYGFLVYLAVILAVAVSLFLSRSRAGLYLRAVGENPATADAAGINVTRYKYLATCIGGMIAGLGGLFYIMDYSNGIWSNNGFGDRGWLAIAIVIFATWKPTMAILGSYLFGALYILFNYLNVPMRLLPLIQMLPYLVTIIVLVAVSIRKKRENQPPASLGLSYFREER